MTVALPCASNESVGPEIRAASAVEVFNLPLFEAPPILDVRGQADFFASHVVCAVSAPLEDGNDVQRLLQRILDHDDEYGWCLQHPFTVVYDDNTFSRVQWIVDVLTQAVLLRTEVLDLNGGDRGERLLRCLACQCRQILHLRHCDFCTSFGFCCSTGATWAFTDFFNNLGPLPRCASLYPRIFLAGRQVQITPDVVRLLGVTHIVVNADSLDVMDSTSGGGSCQGEQRVNDIVGVEYLKCQIPDREDDPEVPQVLQGVAQFLMDRSANGAAMIRLHGQSRGASAVCAFLMVARGLSVEAAWRAFCDTKVKLDPNKVWWEALRRMPSTGLALQSAPET